MNLVLMTPLSLDDGVETKKTPGVHRAGWVLCGFDVKSGESKLFTSTAMVTSARCYLQQHVVKKVWHASEQRSRVRFGMQLSVLLSSRWPSTASKPVRNPKVWETYRKRSNTSF